MKTKLALSAVLAASALTACGGKPLEAPTVAAPAPKLGAVPTDNVSIEPPLSQLAQGKTYAEVRLALLEAGWVPTEQRDDCGFVCTSLRSEGYPETEDCADTGTAPCRFIFASPLGKPVVIYTNGENLGFSGWQRLPQGTKSSLPQCPADTSWEVVWTNCFGEGKSSWEGSSYSGEWRDNQFNGKGTLIWTNGDVYEGEFRDDRYSGQGTMTYADGRTYVGQWVPGRGGFLGFQHGEGTMTYPDGRVQSGRWQGGDFVLDTEIQGQKDYLGLQAERQEDDRRAAEQERAAQAKTPLNPNFLRQEIMSSRPKQQAIINSLTPDLYGKCLSVSITMSALAIKYASADKALIENITNTLQLLNATLGHYRTHLISTGYPVEALNVAFRAYPIQGENIPEPWMNECLQVVSSVWVK